MKYLAKDVAEKHDLENKGFTCKGMHNIYEKGQPTGQFLWEFDLPEEPKQPEQELSSAPIEQSAPEPAKRRGNPNWLKKERK